MSELWRVIHINVLAEAIWSEPLVSLFIVSGLQVFDPLLVAIESIGILSSLFHPRIRGLGRCLSIDNFASLLYFRHDEGDTCPGREWSVATAFLSLCIGGLRGKGPTRCKLSCELPGASTCTPRSDANSTGPTCRG